MGHHGKSETDGEGAVIKGDLKFFVLDGKFYVKILQKLLVI